MLSVRPTRVPSSTLFSLQTEPQWDSTSKAGDDMVGRMEKVGKGRDAEEFLRQNPELKAIHSLSSAKALLESVLPKEA